MLRTLYGGMVNTVLLALAAAGPESALLPSSK
jgi:hypothetical protein